MSLPSALLGLLNYGSMTGYELKSVFDQSVNYFWTAQLSQIYRDLGGLEKKGYVDSQVVPQEGRPNKKVYSITGAGQTALDEWLNSPPARLAPAYRDEISVRVFFASRLGKDELLSQLEQYAAEVQERLDFLSCLDKGKDQHGQKHPGEVFYWMLTRKKGVLIYRAELEWAEFCIRELQKLPDDNDRGVSKNENRRNRRKS